MPVNAAITPQPRRGLLAGGNFIVDTVIRIDRYPGEDMLANVLDESPSNGGGPYNVLRDLAALGARFPLQAVGLVGDDSDGRWIVEDCRRHGIDTTGLQQCDAPTSHTHVMTVRDTGRRTFFHHRGANRLLARHHFDFNATSARLFYLGYLMLLDTLDERDESGRSGASRVLEAARRAGLTTIVDLVSVEHADFRPTVLSALPWVDHLVINEVEAGNLLGEDLPGDDRSRLEEAAVRILALGVGGAVVIHSPAGGVAASRTEGTHAQGSVLLPRGLFRGSNGAGDAFAAGYLYGLHEGWDLSQRLRLAVGTAACSLTDPAPSAGIRSSDACLELFARYGSPAWERLEPAVPASTAT